MILECAKDIALNSEDFYVKSGKQTIKLKQEIEKAIKKKFKTKSDILDTINFDNDENTLNILVYSILMFVMKTAGPQAGPFHEKRRMKRGSSTIRPTPG